VVTTEGGRRPFRGRAELRHRDRAQAGAGHPPVAHAMSGRRRRILALPSDGADARRCVGVACPGARAPSSLGEDP